MNNELGKIIKVKIKNYLKNKSIKKAQIIKEFEITTQYLNDIENGKRVPSYNLMKKIAKVLMMSEEDKTKMYDLASKSYKKKKVPVDIAEFIINNEKIQKEIRKAMNSNKL